MNGTPSDARRPRLVVYNCTDHQQFTVGVVSIVILEPYNKEAMCGIEGFICVQVSGTIMFLSENPAKRVTYSA